MSLKPIVARLNAVTFPMIEAEREILSACNVDLVELEGATDDEILAVAGQAEAIMIVSAYLHGPVIRQLSRLRVISRLGTGIDKIDIEEATRCGIIVANLPDFSTEEVADHTLALILASERRLKFYEAGIRSGKRPSSVEGIHRLAVRTLGIIGFGRIGKAVARRARAFGMSLLVYDPLLAPGEKNEWGVEVVDFKTILSQSDYLSLLCPLTPESREMIRREQLRMMKPTATLINTGRGELVNEDDLVEALKTGVIHGAAIDVFSGINVFSESGFSTNHPYFSLENMLLTPHVSANSEEAMISSKTGGALAVADVLRGFYPRHVVNRDVVPRIPLRDARNEDNV